jgi:hypothetical protein
MVIPGKIERLSESEWVLYADSPEELKALREKLKCYLNNPGPRTEECTALSEWMQARQATGDAHKHDAGKLRLDLIPPEAILALGEVLTYGAEKYGANTWQSVAPERYEAALLRHLMAHKVGAERDVESGITHLAHALCNAAFLVALAVRGRCAGDCSSLAAGPAKRPGA